MTAVPRAANDTSDTSPGEDVATCDPQPARVFIGQQATAQIVERAREVSGACSARTLRPGQMVTMEYHGGRLNLDVDAANIITDARCG